MGKKDLTRLIQENLDKNRLSRTIYVNDTYTRHQKKRKRVLNAILLSVSDKRSSRITKRFPIRFKTYLSCMIDLH